MADLVTVKIDGKEVKVPPGTNLIEAAETAGVHIPSLCYLKGMRGVGACRLCVVEVQGTERLIIACMTRVREGMNVATNTERVLEARKFVIDLILSMHPLDCLTCTKAGVCNLQKYAYDLELKESSFTWKRFDYPTDEANPFIKRDPDYCILCGRCVRICKAQGTTVLDFMRRGIKTKVTTARDRALHESGCTFCGSCVDVCPVNALVEADRWGEGREWELEQVKSVCLYCGNGCDIDVSRRRSKIVSIVAGAPESSVEHYLCAIGRFGFDYIHSDIRVLSPMKRVDGKLEATTWEEALDIVAGKLKDSSIDVGFVSAASIFNEDALVLRRFAENVVKTKNFDTTVSLYAEAESMKLSGVANIDEADLIVVVGLNPSQWERVLPALDASIRKRVERGAKLIVINFAEIGLSSIANITLRGGEVSNLKAMTKALIDMGFKADKELEDAVSDIDISEDIRNAAILYSESKNPLIFSASSLYAASANIALLRPHFSPTAPVVAVPAESNAKGVVLMGLTTKNKTYKNMISGDVKVLYVIGEIPLKTRPNVDFLIVQSSHFTELSREADIVFPSAAALEAGGSVVDYLGRLKYLHKAVAPAGEAKSHRKIFIELSKVMGSPIKEPAETEIKKSLRVEIKPSFSPFEKKERLDLGFYEMIELVKASVVGGSRLLWLKKTGIPKRSSDTVGSLS